MDERFLYDFRTGCGNSAKFARIFDMGFMYFANSFKRIYFYKNLLNTHIKWRREVETRF